jgi:flagellar protein FliO/FliZ
VNAPGATSVTQAIEVRMQDEMPRGEGLALRARSLLSRVSFISLACFSGLAHAAERPFAAPQAAEGAPASGAGSLLQVTLSLFLVLAAVFAAAWLMRRLRGFGKVGPGAIEVLADLPLSTKERAVLVQVGKQQLLLGVAPGRVNTLHVLAEPLPVQSAQQTQGDLTAAGRPDFKAILKRSLGL